jgi:hypothetical protein
LENYLEVRPPLWWHYQFSECLSGGLCHTVWQKLQ